MNIPFKLSYILVFFVVTFCSLFPAYSQDVSYTIRIDTSDSLPSLQVNSTFRTDRTGVLQLSYSDKEWGQQNLFESLQSVYSSDENTTINIQKDKGSIQVTYPKGRKEVSLSYRIVQDTPGGLTMSNRFRPVVQPNFFHMFGRHFLILPEYSAEDTLSISVSWTNLPNGYSVFNSYSSDTDEINIKELPVYKLRNIIFVGGDYVRYSTDVHGSTVHFVTRGQWIPFTNQQLQHKAITILTHLREFWKDYDWPEFTIVVSPLDKSIEGGYAGTSLYNSFNSQFANTDLMNLNDVQYLFAHELNHGWIGDRIENENEEQQYWFSEGFTEYYTHKITAQMQANPDQASQHFIQSLNSLIAEHVQSPVRSTPNSSITTDFFWKNQENKKLPYNRGALFAFYLDQRIHTESGGQQNLDTVMHSIYKKAKSSGQKLSNNYFIKAVNPFVSKDITPEFEKYIEKGELLPLDSLFSQWKLEYTPFTTQLQPMGITYADANGTIAGVEKNSDAEKAGFRAGDQVIEYEENPEPDKMAKYMIKRGAETIPISILRKGIQKPIPQLLYTEKTKKNLPL